MRPFKVANDAGETFIILTHTFLMMDKRVGCWYLAACEIDGALITISETDLRKYYTFEGFVGGEQIDNVAMDG